jgi:hypothetical protein
VNGQNAAYSGHPPPAARLVASWPARCESFDLVGAGDQVPFGGVVGCEADRVSVGLGDGNAEAARDRNMAIRATSVSDG